MGDTRIGLRRPRIREGEHDFSVRGPTMAAAAPGGAGSLQRAIAFRPSLHSRPARHRRSDETEVGSQVVDESKTNIREEHVMEAITGLDADQLTFECMADRDQSALPPNPPAGSDLAG